MIRMVLLSEGKRVLTRVPRARGFKFQPASSCDMKKAVYHHRALSSSLSSHCSRAVGDQNVFGVVFFLKVFKI